MIDVVAFLAQVTPSSDAPAASPMAGVIQTVVMFAGIIGIMWFLVIRPQKKQQQQRQAMLASLKKNDRVLTTGGIFGTVMNVKEDEVVVRIDDNSNVRVRMARSAVSEITDRGTDDES